MAAGTLTSGEGQRAFDDLMRRIERRIYESEVVVAGCDETQVKARLAQRIVELALPEFLKQAYASHAPFPVGTVQAGGLSIEPATGHFTVSLRLALRCVAQFGASWLRILGALLKGMVRSYHSSTPVTILFDGGVVSCESDARLRRFCREGPIAPLRSAKAIVVQAEPPPSERRDESLVYAARPLEYLAMTSSAARGWQALAAHIVAPAELAVAIARNPGMVLIARDFAALPIMSTLDAAKAIEAIVISTSDFMSQPLWMKGVNGQHSKVHMLWYAQNIVPVQTVEEPEPYDFPGFRNMRIDVHWVWTEDFICYLRQLGQTGDAFAVGPILWYLQEPNRPPEPPTSQDVRLAIFDITPHAPDKLLYGFSRNFYHTGRRMAAFIGDIVAVAEQLQGEIGAPVSLLLKHKRATTRSHHDLEYLDLIDRLSAPNGPLVLVDPSADLYDMVGSSTLSISVPYTSTALVALHLGKPTIYYDPFGDIVVRTEGSAIQFAAGRAALYRTLKGLGQ